MKALSRLSRLLFTKRTSEVLLQPEEFDLLLIFLVYDRDDRNVLLLEVKSRNFDDPSEPWLNAGQLRWYKKYWPESIVAVIIPGGHYFYAQRAGELQHISGDRNINLTEEFEWFEDVFIKVSIDALYRFKDDVINLFKRGGGLTFQRRGGIGKLVKGGRKEGKTKTC